MFLFVFKQFIHIFQMYLCKILHLKNTKEPIKNLLYIKLIELLLEIIIYKT